MDANEVFTLFQIAKEAQGFQNYAPILAECNRRLQVISDELYRKEVAKKKTPEPRAMPAAKPYEAPPTPRAEPVDRRPHDANP